MNLLKNINGHLNGKWRDDHTTKINLAMNLKKLHNIHSPSLLHNFCPTVFSYGVWFWIFCDGSFQMNTRYMNNNVLLLPKIITKMCSGFIIYIYLFRVL